MISIDFRNPSRRFAGALQIALAMVLTYWFALSWDWSHPKWAAFAVAVIAMPTVEESIGKGEQRLLGTLLAVVVALVIVALFAQDRWMFMLCLSSWLAFCTYMSTGVRNNYFWMVAGFVVAIIAMNVAPNPDTAFALAVIRTLETALGIVCYTLVVTLLWPMRQPGAPTSASAAPAFFPDRDRLEMAARVFLIYWLAFLCIVYIPDVPGGLAFLTLFGALAMIKGTAPQMPVRMLYKPVAFGILVASLIYMLLMPRLEGFGQLGLLIFLYTFGASYLYHQPQQGLNRLFALVVFSALTGIGNDQAYTFTAVSTVILQFFCLFLLLQVAEYLPVSTRPEKTVLRQMARFCRSARALAADTDTASPSGFFQRWRLAGQRHEVATLPGKLAPWVARVRPGLPPDQQQELDGLITTMGEVKSALLQTGEAGETSETSGDSDTDGALERFFRYHARVEWARLEQPRF